MGMSPCLALCHSFCMQHGNIEIADTPGPRNAALHQGPGFSPCPRSRRQAGRHLEPGHSRSAMHVERVRPGRPSPTPHRLTPAVGGLEGWSSVASDLVVDGLHLAGADDDQSAVVGGSGGVVQVAFLGTELFVDGQGQQNRLEWGDVVEVFTPFLLVARFGQARVSEVAWSGSLFGLVVDRVGGERGGQPSCVGVPDLGGSIVLVWDNLNVHLATGIKEFITGRSWLTVYQLPSYASDLNPLEGIWSLLRRG